jgi:predicted cation transporter
MGRAQILSFALSLLISGGILIPGNIPNIISAAKLDIKSREWARAAIPAGVALLTIYFLALTTAVRLKLEEQLLLLTFKLVKPCLV